MAKLLVRFLAGLFLAFGGAVAVAAEVSPHGRWAVRAAGQTVMLLELVPVQGRAGAWAGHLSLLQQKIVANSGDTLSFIDVRGPVVRMAVAGTRRADGSVHLVATGEEPRRVDMFLLRVTSAGTAELSFADAPPEARFPALPMVRAAAAEAVSENWDANQSYAVVRDFPSSAEMAAIFKADQADRSGPGVDWNIVGQRDEARRLRTRELLEKGALNSAADFYHAAFVFQHGGKPADYLLAHTLAMAAIARGRADAAWIASATLDRYLQAMDQPQIFGTQFVVPSEGSTTQEPYDRTLVPDALRKVLAVPSLAEQEIQRRKYDERKGTTSKK